MGSPDNAATTKLFFFHHHPSMCNDLFMGLKNSCKLWPIACGRLDVLLFGHQHVSKVGENKGGVRFVLAADNSPGKAYAPEIAVSQKNTTVQDVSIA